MSIDSSKFDRQVIRKLKDDVTILKKQNLLNEYCINHLKAEIRLLRDTITNIQDASKDYLYKHEGMNETLEMKLENGAHLTHNGDEIKYVGEHMSIYGTEFKRKR